ncbi:thioredoxin domain-containing protein 8 [Molossus molossus]|uniref:Thioredoxin n=1 Tax=Molossus molossus TaxID=27622 RepID=A0A7J8EHX6_MOLMO|nr:thioredoxin domain-containing protein 8 [Molossus molossus]KAF6434759.1 thioredoxin domain containing 8 [Molossus molossus]
MVQIIKDWDEFQTVLKAAGCKLVVVEFSAKWCGPCKRICPLVHAMSLQYQNVMFANVDVDDAQELAQNCHIRVVPTFQMYKQARKIFEFCGADAKKLEAKIQELM